MVKKVTSLANAQITKNLVGAAVGVPAVVAAVDIQADIQVAEAKNATNAVKLVILRATALKVVAEVTTAVVEEAAATEVVMVADILVVAVEEVEVKLATLVAGLVIWLATAPKARSATTVSGSHAREVLVLLTNHPGGEVGHLSRDCPSEPSSERTCYKCKQPGHVQASCPN